MSNDAAVPARAAVFSDSFISITTGAHTHTLGSFEASGQNYCVNPITVKNLSTQASLCNIKLWFDMTKTTFVYDVVRVDPSTHQQLQNDDGGIIVPNLLPEQSVTVDYVWALRDGNLHSHSLENFNVRIDFTPEYHINYEGAIPDLVTVELVTVSDTDKNTVPHFSFGRKDSAKSFGYLDPNSPEAFAASGKVFYLESKLGGFYAHVFGGGTKNDSNITLWSKVDQPNLKWKLKPVSGHNGYYHLVSLVDAKRDRVLHQHGKVKDNDGNVTLWQAVNEPNCRVRCEEATENGWYFIIFEHSNKCVHVPGSVRSNGANITQYEQQDQDNFKWRFVSA